MTQLLVSLDSCEDDCLKTNCQQQIDADCGRLSTVDCGARPKTQINKKFQKMKYKIDQQNFAMAKLKREIEMKAHRGFPSPCLRLLQSQYCSEQKKLNAMIEKATDEQARAGCSKDSWKPITLSFDDIPACRKSLKPPSTPSGISKVSAFSNLNFCESILSDNQSLDSERNELQEQLICKDEAFQELEDKIELLQSQMIKICHENQTMAKKLEESQSRTSQPEYQKDVKTKIQSVVSNADKLSCGIHQLESNLAELRNDLHQVKKEKKIAFNFEQELQATSCAEEKSNGDNAQNPCPSLRPKSCPCNPCDVQAAAKLKCFKSQYENLQIEYCRKEKESKETVERLKKCLDNCKGDKERAENEALKNRADELVAEISDYKIFIKELQEHVDMYRDKFMKGKRSAFKDCFGSRFHL